MIRPTLCRRSAPAPRPRPTRLFALLLACAAAALPICRLRAQAPTAAPPGGAAAQIGADVITGVVVDSATGAPLPAAQVRLVGLGRGDVTHEDGTFRIAGVAAGVYTLSVQRLGYAPATRAVRVPAGDSAQVRIALSAAARTLGSVVVTGTVGERLERDVLSPTTVVTGAELDRRADATVAATLRSQPGVAVSSIGPATARPVIRGLGGDRILMLEDGMRPGDLSATSGDHAVAIEPLTAEQIEVVRGPMSLLYGPNALGGVVNVVREEVPASRPDQAHGTASVQGTSVNRGVTTGGYATAPLGRLAVRAEGTVREAGDLRTPAGLLRNTDARTYNASAGASLAGDWGHAGGAYRLFDSRYGIPGGFVGSHPQGVEIDMRRHTGRAEAELRSGLGPFSSARLAAAYTSYRHLEFARSDRASTSFAQELAAVDGVARHAALGSLGTGAVGFRLQYRDITTAGSLRTPSTYDLNAAGFVVEELAIGRLRLQGGARYDWARYVPRETDATVDVGGVLVPVRNRTFGAATGSLGGLYDLGRGARLGASVSRAYRTPDFNELYSDGPHLAANSYDVGNPGLGAETGVGADVFARVTRPRLRAEVAVFRNEIDGYIYPRNTGERGRQGGRYKFQYTGQDARLAGAEGSAELSVRPAVVLDATLSYVRGTLLGAVDSLPAEPLFGLPARAGSRDLPFIPPLGGRVGVRYDRPRFFVGGAVRFADRQSRLGDFEEPTAGYGAVDAVAGVRLLAGSRLHAVTLRLDNVLDQEYRDHLSRVKAIMPEAGRGVSLLYRLVF